MAKAIPNLLLECKICGKQTTLKCSLLETYLDEPLSINTVGFLYDKLVCGCGQRKFQASDDAGRVLLDSDKLTRCRVCKNAIPLPRLAAVNTDKCFNCASQKPAPAAPHPRPPPELSLCPRCKKFPTVVRQNKLDRSYFLACEGFPKCRWSAPLD